MPFLIELGENDFMIKSNFHFAFAWVLSSLLFCPAVRASDIDFKKELLSLDKIESHINIDEAKYEYVVIDFWASWCDPCKESIPYYEKLHKDFPKNKVLFITVNLDDEKSEGVKFLKEYPSDFNSYWDKTKVFMKKLNFESIPYLVVLDKSWKILESIKGYNSKTKGKVKSYFTK